MTVAGIRALGAVAAAFALAGCTTPIRLSSSNALKPADAVPVVDVWARRAAAGWTPVMDGVRVTGIATLGTNVAGASERGWIEIQANAGSRRQSLAGSSVVTSVSGRPVLRSYGEIARIQVRVNPLAAFLTGVGTLFIANPLHVAQAEVFMKDGRRIVIDADLVCSGSPWSYVFPRWLFQPMRPVCDVRRVAVALESMRWRAVGE